MKFQKYFISWIHINDVNYSNEFISCILGMFVAVLDGIHDPSCGDIFLKKCSSQLGFSDNVEGSSISRILKLEY